MRQCMTSAAVCMTSAAVCMTFVGHTLIHFLTLTLNQHPDTLSPNGSMGHPFWHFLTPLTLSHTTSHFWHFLTPLTPGHTTSHVISRWPPMGPNGAYVPHLQEKNPTDQQQEEAETVRVAQSILPCCHSYESRLWSWMVAL